MKRFTLVRAYLFIACVFLGAFSLHTVSAQIPPPLGPPPSSGPFDPTIPWVPTYGIGPSNLQFSNITSTSCDVSWDPGTSGCRLDISKNGQLYKSIFTNSIAWQSIQLPELNPNTHYDVWITPLDQYGMPVYDMFNTGIGGWFETKEGPPQITSSYNITKNGFNIGWERSPTAMYYEIYLNGQWYDMVWSSSYTFDGLASNTNYSVVIARFGMNSGLSFPSNPYNMPYNSSEFSEPYSVTTLATLEAPLNVAVLSTTSSKITITWTAVQGGNIYEIYNGNNLVGTSSGTTFTLSGLNPNTAYAIKIRAGASTGEWSDDSDVLTATTALAIAAPTDLASSQITSKSACLTWTACTDSRVIGYEILCEGTVVGSSTSPSYLLTGLHPETTYQITVRAMDGDNNRSAESAALAVTTKKVATGATKLPAEWAAQYGLDPEDIMGDPDGDGISNIAEYNLATNPRQADLGASSRGGNLIPAEWNTLVAANSSREEATHITPDDLKVDKNGALTYSVPIFSVPGIAGMQPEIALNYNSQATGGIAGYGWSLGGFSTITRTAKTLASDGEIQGVDYSRKDVYSLDGERLKYIPGIAHSYDGAEYRNEHDTFTRVIAKGKAGEGPQSFIAYTKTGWIIEFGGTSDSRLCANSATHVDEVQTWAVSSVTDYLGNYMSYKYSTNAETGEQYLERIDYTGNSATNLAPFASLQFEYETRADVSFHYIHGAKFTLKKRLKMITAYYEDTLVRKYVLDYIERYPSGRSLLISIAETGSDKKASPSLKFDYTNPPDGWLPIDSASWNTPNDDPADASGNNSGYVDLDGDGYPDYIDGNALHGIKIWLNRPNGLQRNMEDRYRDFNIYEKPVYHNNLKNGILVDEGGFTLNRDRIAKYVDLNFDGLPDIVLSSGEVMINTGADFEFNKELSLPFTTPYAYQHYEKSFEEIQTYERTSIRFFDINGDNRLDCFIETNLYIYDSTYTGNLEDYYPDYSPFYVKKFFEIWINTGKITENGSIWKARESSVMPYDPEKNLLFDINGDGVTDIIMSTLMTDIWDHGAAFNQMSLIQKNGQFLRDDIRDPVPCPLVISNVTFGESIFNPAELIDINGDGLIDIVYSNVAGSGKDHVFKGQMTYLNTGAGWERASDVYDSPYDLIKPLGMPGSQVIMLDINNDNCIDILHSSHLLQECRLGASAQGWKTDPAMVWKLPRSMYDAMKVGPNNVEISAYSGAELIDINADGAIDEVWPLQIDAPVKYPGAALNKRAHPDRLISVTNGSGFSSIITYAPLTERDTEGNSTVYEKSNIGLDYKNISDKKNIIAPMYVVKTITRKSDKIDVMSATQNYTLEYHYGHLKVHRIYGNLGFEWMSITDTRTDITTITEFSQDYPTIGRAVKMYAKSPTGILLSETNITYGIKLLNAGDTNFIFAQTTDIKTYNLNDGVILTHTITETDRNGDGADYDAFGNPTRVTTISGDGDEKITTITLYAYDNITNDSKWILGRLTATESTTTHNLSSIIQKKSYSYDSKTGLLLTATEEPGDSSLSYTVVYTYDAYGNRISVTQYGDGIANRITQIEFDITNRFPARIVNAEGHIESYSYDAIGSKTSYTDPNGLITEWAYDGFGRPKKEIRSDGTITTISYRWTAANTNLAGVVTLVLTETTGSAPVAAFYDCWGHTTYTLTLNPGGFGEETRIVVTRKEYDNRSRVIRTWLPVWYGDIPSMESETTYDIKDRPLVVKRADEDIIGGFASTFYSYEGLTIKSTDSLGRIEQLDSDIHGRTSRRINNAGASKNSAERGEVTYAYDPLGRLVETQVSRENGTVTTKLNYDIRGRRIEMDDPDVGKWSYGYNAAGELTTQTDAKSQTTTLTYDKLGRLLTRKDVDGTSEWTYDTSTNGIGKLAHIKHSDTGHSPVEETFAYDGLGRPISHKRTINGLNYEMVTEYDAYSRPLIAKYPSGFKVKNVYTALGFLKEIREAGGRLDGYKNEVPSNYLFWQAESFTPAGSVTAATLGNGLTYDRIISTVTGRIRGITSTSLAPGAIAVQNQLYIYDAIGQVKHREDTLLGQVENYTYDGLNRLTRHKSSAITAPETGGINLGAFDLKASYDAIGNIVTKSNLGDYVYDSIRPHAVVKVGNATYAYDANGNMISGAGRTFAYTAANKVRMISQGQRWTQFSFDADRQRVIQTATDGTTTTYVDASFEKIEDVQGLIEYKHYIFTPFGRTAVRTARSDKSIETRYFHQDALGTIQAVTDECGHLEMRFAYDAWGSQTTLFNKRDVDGGKQTRGFTDHEMLEDFGLVHMNARLYDSAIGRFISADRLVQDIGNSQAYNRYSYCANNPVNAIDPTGNNWLSEVWTWFAGMFGPDDDTEKKTEQETKPTESSKSDSNAGAASSQTKDGGASATNGSLLNGSSSSFSSSTTGIPANASSSNTIATAGYDTEAAAATGLAKLVAMKKKVTGREYGGSIFRYSLNGGKTFLYGITPITEGFFFKDNGRAYWNSRWDYTGVGLGGGDPKLAMFTDPISGKDYPVDQGLAGKVSGIEFTADLHMHPNGSKLGFSDADFDTYRYEKKNGYLLDQSTGKMFFSPFEVFRVKDAPYPDTFYAPDTVPRSQKQIPMDTISPAELKGLGL